MAGRQGAVPHGTTSPTPRHRLSEDETYLIARLAERLSPKSPALALLTKHGDCVAVLITPSEFSLLKDLEEIAANPEVYTQIQEEAKFIEAGKAKDIFVPPDVVFGDR